MARFAYGKGKKKSYWDVEQLGRILRTQESDRLSGYRTFGTDTSARAELERLVAERITKKFVPDDDDARAMAALVDKPVETPAPATLPLRRDLSVYNEATGFMVTSMDMAGVTLEEGSKKWNKAITDAKMIPVTLFQDDPFVVRVVAGEPLTSDEAEEWVARLEWPLDVPGGKVAITGGAVLVNEEYDVDDRYYESYLRTVDVPPGRYRATVYSYVPGINGSAVLDYLAGGYDRHERFGAWFRRTRPGEAFPPWLVEWCVGRPDQDPGHEEEWRATKRPDDSTMPEYVHFLVHLEPDPDAKPSGKPPAEGWFGEAENARKPDRCPAGLAGRDVQGHEDETSGGWMYLFEIPSKASGFAVVPISGGPVDLAPGDFEHLYRIARFSHGHTIPAFRAVLPESSTFPAPVLASPDAIALLRGRTLEIGFSNNLQPGDIFDRITGLEPLFASLPDGTQLEMASSQVEERAFETETPVGLHRYRGRLEGGVWRITDAFPKMDAATLRSALALAREVAGGDAITMRDTSEGDAVLKWATVNHKIWIEDNPGTITNGRLSLGTREPGVLSLYGSSAFAVRFRDTWPVLDFSDDDDAGGDDDDGDLSTPIQGTKVLETPGGRMYFVTMALLVSETLAERIQTEERSLIARGYANVGDVVCNIAPKVAIRGYAKNGGDTWASYMVAAPETLVFELSTRFERDDASLVTTRLRDARDDLSKKSYRQPLPDAPFAEMEQRHEQRKAELAAIHGAPIAVERSHAGFAQAIEAALKKQYGG